MKTTARAKMCAHIKKNACAEVSAQTRTIAHAHQNIRTRIKTTARVYQNNPAHAKTIARSEVNAHTNKTVRTEVDASIEATACLVMIVCFEGSV